MVALQAFLLAAVVISAIGAATDLRSGEIPNWLTLGPLALAPLVHLGVTAARSGLREGLEAAGFSVLGAVVCALVPYVLFVKGGMFGGDVKLLAALGAICRPLLGIEAEFYAFIAAAVLAMAKMTWDGKLLRVLGNTARLAFNPFLPEAKRRPIENEMMTLMRFGPAIFLGMLATALIHWRGL